MNNIVDFGSGRGRPSRSNEVKADGARILLFTGVRYERFADDALPSFVSESETFRDAELASVSEGSGVAFELANR